MTNWVYDVDGYRETFELEYFDDYDHFVSSLKEDRITVTTSNGAHAIIDRSGGGATRFKIEPRYARADLGELIEQKKTVEFIEVYDENKGKRERSWFENN